MDKYYYFKTLRKTIIQFLNIFNNIKIAKYNNNGDIIKHITIPIKLAHKQKFYYWLYDRKHEKRFPSIGVSINGLTPAINSRGVNKTANIYCDNNILKNFIPYDLSLTLSIATLHMVESDQILEQILPFFDPYVMMRVNIDEINSYFDSKVLLESVSPELETEIPENDYRSIIWNLEFNTNTYFIKPITESKKIHDIYLNLKDKSYYDETLEGSGYFETLHVSGYEDDSGKIISDYEILELDDE